MFDNMKQKVYIILMLVAIVGTFFITQGISNYKEKINNLEIELNELRHYKNRTEDLKAQTSKLHKNIENLRDRKKELQNKLENKYTFHLPTPQEVRKVVEETDIDKRRWTEDYDCTEFSFDLIEKLKDRGILSCSVELNFEEGTSHVLIATNTTKGIRYIEPYSDVIFSKMSLGNDYCNLVDWSCEEPWGISKISSCYGILKVSK